MTTLADTAIPSLAAKSRLKWDAVRQKNMLLFPEGVLVLNPASQEILALCDGRRTVAEIVKTLVERFGNPAIDADVRELLLKLTGKKLVVIAE